MLKRIKKYINRNGPEVLPPLGYLCAGTDCGEIAVLGWTSPEKLAAWNLRLFCRAVKREYFEDIMWKLLIHRIDNVLAR